LRVGAALLGRVIEVEGHWRVAVETVEGREGTDILRLPGGPPDCIGMNFSLLVCLVAIWGSAPVRFCREGRE
jgi:hypothetical protein